MYLLNQSRYRVNFSIEKLLRRILSVLSVNRDYTRFLEEYPILSLTIIISMVRKSNGVVNEITARKMGEKNLKIKMS